VDAAIAGALVAGESDVACDDGGVADDVEADGGGAGAGAGAAVLLVIVVAGGEDEQAARMTSKAKVTTPAP